ncbi:hypothetical protein GCM10010276_56540 [Streptomyces longisporus]|uniref:Uncharacterized protein n=1 Tax=Streptomyces longisporus TaxID=1948 RepID=A0ABN3MPK4_STRLO
MGLLSARPNSIRFGLGSPIRNCRRDPLRFETSERPNGREDSPSDWESGPKGSDRVGNAGKGNAKAGTWKAPRKSGPETV